MSWPLHVHGQVARPFDRTILGRVSSSPISERPARRDVVVLLEELGPADVDGYGGVLTCARPSARQLADWADRGPILIHSLSYLHHLADGDVVALNPNGYVRTLYRRGSPHNAIFATDRCNSWCLMCSQPPRPIDDRDRIVEHLRLIDLIEPSCRELGITGGEPTLLGDDFLRLIAYCRDQLPTTGLHVLTNGRRFCDDSFARRLAALEHADLVLGIPLYSAIDSQHDYIVQARGAYEQTVNGLHHLGRYGVQVEIRVVIHRLTFRGLKLLAEFIYRNLPFAGHVTFMGLELMGFAVPNAQLLWIDPWDYRGELTEAVLYLAATGMRVSIYNHQLCVVPRQLWPFCRQSISDWKNDYLPECAACAVRERCGGFFTSSLKRQRSRQIAPVSSQDLN